MIQNRHDLILEWLQTEKTISAAELSNRLQVSSMTVWRDLKFLEEQGLLKRVRGGAASIPLSSSSSSLHAHFQLNPSVFSPIKTRIGRYAAHFLVEANDNIILEGGTTVSSMVPYLDQSNLTILTNGMNTMMLAAPLIDRMRVLCCGGVLNKYANSFIGPQAESFFSGFRVEKVFLSATGITLEDEFTDPEPLYSSLKNAMRRSGEKVIVLVDSSKFGQRTLNQVLRFSEVDILVTDSGAPQNMLDALTEKGIDVHIAP
jgi:DeoR/GlpR family transcriptional regulator of sugar metabolism